MKKIGIMTWFSFDNYGSVLQAFSLYNMLKKMENDVEFINYRPKVRKKTLLDLGVSYYYHQLFNKIKKNKYKKEFVKIHNLFDNFRTINFKYSDQCNGYTDLKNISNDYDKVICGSDQVWSPISYDENYFLPFVNSDKKIAYAPSIGVSKITDSNLLKKIKTDVETFKYTSFREENVKKILGISNANIVVDPTLLFDSNEWDELLKFKECDNNNNNSNYILCYFLADNKKYNKIAMKLAKLTNYTIKYIPINKNTLNDYNSVIWNCGPSEFVKAIRNASFVLTDSYHGMLFSLIYNKKFYILERFKNNNKESQNSRIYNVLNKYNLSNRLIASVKDIDINNTIDYEIINKKIEFERINSINYIKESIEDNQIQKRIANVSDIKCTGCGMCAAICPKKCISIKLNENGFYTTKIDKKKCINCGLCRNVCGQNNNQSKSLFDKNLFFSKSNDINIIKNSTSGGIAHEISKWGLTNNYSIIGCKYNYDKNIAEHIIVDNIKDLNKLSGSKYLQSYTVDAFEKIKQLDKAIIIGTPCQIASIDNYLKMIKKREKFVLIDLICHGVPTYNLWKKTISNVLVNNVKFRDKRKGWHKILLTINNKKVDDKKFYNYFNYNLVYNECCYNCNYRANSSADLRLGDYWNRRYKKEKNGISMVIAITETGNNVLNSIDNITIVKQSINDYYKMQQSENELIPIDYYNIMNDLENNKYNWNKLYKKYCKKRVYDRKIRTYGYKIVRFLLKK